mgnify:CR=1 FL=1
MVVVVVVVGDDGGGSGGIFPLTANQKKMSKLAHIHSVTELYV